MKPEVDRDLVVELTRELVRFPSVNPPGNELEVADFLGQRMRDLGLQAELHPVAEQRANLIGRIPGSGTGHLVFTGHLDVVPPGEQPWSHPPFAAELVDGRIYGRGSADMKGAVASMVAAIAALARAGVRPRADIILAATAGEEAGLVGAKSMVEGRSLDGSRYLVVGEASNLNVLIGEKGVLWLEVKAFGRTAHGSMPQLGANAISYLARLIPRLEEYPFPFEESPLLGSPTLSADVIQGGNKVNMVADFARVELDMRTVPSQNHGELIAAVRALAEDVAREYNPEIRVELGVDQNEVAVETDRTEPLVAATIQSVGAVLDRRPEVGGVTYATDGAILAPGFDIPMVICGPGDPGILHQPDEHIEVEQLVQAAEIYVDLALRLVG